MTPKNLSKAKQAKFIVRCSEWLGADHCSECGLQNDYCPCDFLDFKSRIPRAALHSPQSGIERPPPTTLEFVDGYVGKSKVVSLPEARKQMIEKFKAKTPYIVRSGGRKFRPQSGIAPDDMRLSSGNTINGTNNIRFSDQPGENVNDFGGETEYTRSSQDDAGTFIGDFFKRPTKIYSTDWAVGTSLGVTFDPWDLYFFHPTIWPKVDHFKMGRCKLHLKFVINGNGFHYGRVLVDHLPLPIWDEFSTNDFAVPEDAIAASQRQHLYLNPTTSTGGEMILPFFYYIDNMDIPYNGWDEMGNITMRSLNDLKHANGATDKATITVFAWAEDMVLTGLTNKVAQSGVEDETDCGNKNGVISGPATSVAKMAHYLTDVPVIGKFAKATEMVASTTAATAKMFGYSKPVMTKEPDPMRPATVGNMATATVPDTSIKLSVDDKQELSIDPNIAGLFSTDSLAIKNIATRESYLTTFPWAMGTADGTMLFNIRVTPYVFAQSAGFATHLPACAAAAMPFAYWTGGMRYRFQFVTSSFHKGRVQISFDADSTTAAAPDTVVTYNRIVDLSEETDVTIEVGPSQEVAWLQGVRIADRVPSDLYGTLPFTFLNDKCNGVIALHVLNELTTPNSTANNDIQVNVFVSCGDDVEFAVPDEYITQYCFKPQSGLEVVDGVSPSQDEPQQTDVQLLGNKPDKKPDSSLVFQGEKISSFRQLLKRYNHWKTISAFSTVATSSKYFRLRHNAFPYWRGNVAGAVDTTGAAAPYNYVNTTLMHWLMAGHQGWRGAIRYKVIPRYNDAANETGIFANRYEVTLGDTPYAEGQAYTSTLANLNSVHYQGMYRRFVDGTMQFQSPMLGMAGGVHNSGAVNPSVEFEVPFYSQLRFSPGKLENLQDNTVTMAPFYEVGICMPKGDSKNLYDMYVAVGEDFQLYNWTGLPRIYYEENPPV